MDVPHYWTADQVGRMLEALGDQGHHPARTGALIMWSTGLRVGGPSSSNGATCIGGRLPRPCR